MVKMMSTQTVYALIGIIEFECEDLLGVYPTEESARQSFIEYQERVQEDDDLTQYTDHYIRPVVLGARAQTPQLDYVYSR